jgi:hypothetical protein
VNSLLDATDLLNIVKKAALDAVNTSQPSDYCFGKVISTKPLKISVEQKMTLGAAQLLLTRNVTDFKTKVTVDWTTETKSGGSGDSAFSSHAHSVSGKKEITIHNALQVGDEVILLKKKGGQKYLVLDRVVKT